MVKEITEIRKSLIKQGWRITRKGGHEMAWPPDKSKRGVAIPTTPSGARWLPNLIRDLRASGFVWKGK